MDKIFDLNNIELKRLENGLYTLGDENLDRFWGLDQNHAVFSPSKQVVEEFVALTYVLGLLGYQTTNFTAVPSGFIVSLKNNNNISTFTINSFSSEINFEKVLEIIATQSINDKKLTGPEKKFLVTLGLTLKDGKNPLEICCDANEKISNSENFNELNNRKTLSSAPFDPVEPSSLNNQNCNNNHNLIRKMCRDMLGYNVDGENLTEQQNNEVEDLYNTILFKNILRFYTHHVGFNKGKNTEVTHDAQILSKTATIKQLLDIVKTSGRLSMLLTIAATDFTADVVYAALNTLANNSNSQECFNAINEIIPKTPYQSENDKALREYINHQTGHVQRGHNLNLKSKK